MVVCFRCLDAHRVEQRRRWKDKGGRITEILACPKCNATTMLAHPEQEPKP